MLLRLPLCQALLGSLPSLLKFLSRFVRERGLPGDLEVALVSHPNQTQSLDYPHGDYKSLTALEREHLPHSTQTQIL